MATIRKRSGKYQVIVRRKGFASTARTFHNKQDALEWSRHLETKADRGELHASIKELDQFTLSEIVERYIIEVTAHKLSGDNEAYILKAFMRHKIASLRLSELTTAHFSKYRDKRLMKVKAGSVNRELGIVQHALDLARTDWHIPLHRNPLSDLRKLKVSNSRERRLAPTEYLRILRAAQSCMNDNVVPIIKIALRTAMRRGEILNIKWEHVNLKRRILHIPITKNGHSRTIPLCSRTVRLLQAQGRQPRGKVFDMTPNAFKLSWQRILKRSEVIDFHFHDFRHEAISHFFEIGLSVPEVALISGHRDYRMLFRYTHMNAESLVGKLG